jgi:hypothetical protein
LAIDAHEAVGPRVEQHPLEPQTVGLVFVSPVRDLHPGGAEPLGELVPHALEFAQVEQPRLGGRRLAMEIELAHGEGSQESIRQLALERGDLAAQRPAGGPLGGSRRHLRWRDDGISVIQQELHNSLLSQTRRA